MANKISMHMVMVISIIVYGVVIIGLTAIEGYYNLMGMHTQMIQNVSIAFAGGYHQSRLMINSQGMQESIGQASAGITSLVKIISILVYGVVIVSVTVIQGNYQIVNISYGSYFLMVQNVSIAFAGGYHQSKLSFNASGVSETVGSQTAK